MLVSGKIQSKKKQRMDIQAENTRELQHKGHRQSEDRVGLKYPGKEAQVERKSLLQEIKQDIKQVSKQDGKYRMKC